MSRSFSKTRSEIGNQFKSGHFRRQRACGDRRLGHGGWPNVPHYTGLSIAPRIDFPGAASFAFFFSAKGAGLDAALPNPSLRRRGRTEYHFRHGAVNSAFVKWADKFNLTPARNRDMSLLYFCAPVLPDTEPYSGLIGRSPI